jgi:hypothetical protein
MNNDQNANSGISATPQPVAPSVITPSQISGKKHSVPGLILTVMALIVAITAGVAAVMADTKSNAAKKELNTLTEQFRKFEQEHKAAAETNEEKVNKDGFQAVFLESGQVYFGRITKISDTQITLENIYYLRTNQNVTPQNVNDLSSSSDISLVKLGEELHGPEDVMYIERKETSFWENLKDDSQVVKAIIEYERTNP